MVGGRWRQRQRQTDRQTYNLGKLKTTSKSHDVNKTLLYEELLEEYKSSKT